MAWIAAHQALLIGLVFMAVLGPAVGNYACSVVFRLPRGQTPFERHPYCGSCGANLQPRDLFPILSWLSTRGRCRYCAMPVPGIYTLIELGCGVVFVVYFLRFGMGEAFLLSAAYGVFVITLAAIQWQQGWIAASVYGYAFTALALLRSLQEGTIYGWAGSAFCMLVLAVAAQRLHGWLNRLPTRPFDAPWIWWMVLMAAWLSPGQWPMLGIPAVLLLLFRFADPAVRAYALLPITALALALPAML
jgi:prepilin signal peptidase PulO-like enzyme (type II secretory pathway)